MSFEDQQILKRSGALDPGHPKGLLNKVWYDIQLHFARRGKEGNRQLKPDSFELKRDENDTEYFTMTFNEETKKHKNPLEVDRENRRGAMFEEPGNPMCPVSSLKKYLRKIPPDAKALYLHPKRRFDASDDIWYSTVPLGVNQLSQMLSRMCIEAGTQSHYTNHSIRATAIQKLSDAGLQAREIIAISGHRSETSLKSYWRPSLHRRKRWSAVLASNEMETTPEKQPKAAKTLSPNNYFTGCTINGNVQINVNNGSENHSN